MPEAADTRHSNKKGDDSIEWYEIPGATGYFINKDGFIKNPVGRVWPGTRTTQGYYELCLTNRAYRKLVHDIMAQVFIRSLEPNEVVDHINNDKTDNRLINLQILSVADNFRKGQEVRDASKTFKRVRQYTLDGKFIAEYASVKEACIALDKNPRSPLISYACRGKCTSNNVNTAYGYKWSYAE